jgi:beta-aspartyl-peptidase (threonine type)
MKHFIIIAVCSLIVILGFHTFDITHPPAQKKKFIVLIHGGAGNYSESMPDSIKRAYYAELERALRTAAKILDDSGSGLDAVEQAIRILEDNPLFNAGRGSVVTSAGRVEMDASIMYGKDLSCGAVAGVTTVKNPISLARLVMDSTKHVLLIAAGAEAFAERMNVPLCDSAYFVTPAMRNKWLEKFSTEKKGTVGAVALDVFGNLAAATSTGGMFGKMPGRVGDSPIINAGTYANNKTCAVSCTGTGELFIRNTVAYNVSALMEYKKYSLEMAVDEMINKRLHKGDGGLIAIDRGGNFAAGFSTTGMLWGMIDSDGNIKITMGR